MIITHKDTSPKFESPHGETVYELAGKAVGNSKNYSFAHVEIKSNCASKMHYHPIAEECYYILSGTGEIILNETSQKISAGDCIAINPNTHHKIINIGKETLHFIVVCAPAWTPDCSVFLE